MAILAECPQCHKKLALRHKVCTGKFKGDIPCEADLTKAKRSKKVKYWITYRLPGGRQKTEVVGFSIEEARDAEGKRRAQKRENRIFDVKPDSKMTFKELSDWYIDLPKVKSLSSYWLIELTLKKFNYVFGNTIISHIKPIDLENYQVNRKAEGKADATIDYEIGTAKTMVIKAFDNDIVSGDVLKTFRVVKKLLKGNGNARDRVLTREEFDSLIEYAPIHLKSVIACGYFTGMRQGEILSLTWDKVDMINRVICLEASDTKDNEPRKIPICNELLEYFKSLPRGIGSKHVFLYEGAPMKSIRDSLKTACKKSDIIYGRYEKDGFVFHDLRHTFNTNMRKSGVPESVIMEITGHSTRAMFDRYNTVDIEDTRRAIDQMEVFLQNVDQMLTKQM